MIPASLAACSGSPFFTAPVRIALSAAGFIVMSPRATASRLVTGLSPTSTIFTRPRRSTWESATERRCEGATVPGGDGAARRRFLATALFLSEIERQAFQRHGQVHAFQLHLFGHLQRTWR